MFDDVLFEPRIPLRPAVTTSFNVDKVLLSSGFEHRNARTQFGRKTYHVPIGQRPIAELMEILDFFAARKGSLRAFRFRDPFSADTASVGAMVTALDVQLGVGDGVASQFQLFQRNGHFITKPVIESVLVAVGGQSLDATAFSVDGHTGQVTMATEPAEGAAVTAGCVFDTPVRFQNDALTLQQTNTGAGEIDDLVLLEVME
ncbi:MAG: TIGR02217 family protein [Pseudomonadota bacterium]